MRPEQRRCAKPHKEALGGDNRRSSSHTSNNGYYTHAPQLAESLWLSAQSLEPDKRVDNLVRLNCKLKGRFLGVDRHGQLQTNAAWAMASTRLEKSSKQSSGQQARGGCRLSSRATCSDPVIHTGDSRRCQPLPLSLSMAQNGSFLSSEGWPFGQYLVGRYAVPPWHGGSREMKSRETKRTKSAYFN